LHIPIVEGDCNGFEKICLTLLPRLSILCAVGNNRIAVNTTEPIAEDQKMGILEVSFLNVLESVPKIFWSWKKIISLDFMQRVLFLLFRRSTFGRTKKKAGT